MEKNIVIIVVINIGEISINNNIKIDIQSTVNNDSRTFYIRTMPSDFPEYKLVGQSEYGGNYYLKLQPNPFYMMKISNDGNVLYYKRDDNNPFFDFKKHNINGKVRYSQLEVNRNIPTVGVFYELGDVVILDENYNEIDRVTLKDNGKVKADSGVENHDFIIIDDGHYIVSSYELRIFDNGWDSKKSRVLQISVDEENKKIVDYKEFSVANRFSMYMGSAQNIDDSNDVFVIGWGSADSDTAIMSEVDFKNDKVLSELHFIDDTKQAYRVYKFK